MTKVKSTYGDILKIITGMPEDIKPFAEKLFGELVFMGETLDKLKTDIINKGVSIDYIGSTGQEATKGNPSLNNYNALIKNYNNTVKQIIDLFPDSEGKEKKDALIDFIRR